MESGFTYIDNCIKWCQGYGLHMVLDLHKTKGYYMDLMSNSEAHWVMDMPKDFSIAYPAPLVEYQQKSIANKQPLLPDYVTEISPVLFEELFVAAIKKQKKIMHIFIAVNMV